MSDVAERLPAGWARASIDELCEINPKHGTELRDGMAVSFIPMAAVSDVSGEIQASQTRTFSEVRRGYTHFADGDVLWAKITPCMENGKAALAESLVNGVGCGSTEFFVLRSHGAVLPAFLHRYMRQESYRRAAKETMQSGVGQARVPKEFVAGTQLSLPPLAEQRRILARVDALQVRSRSTREALELIPPMLERFRQSMLAAAFRGDLTADWRARNPNVEPGNVLLARIQAARRSAWEKAELEKMRASGRIPKTDRWKEEYKPPPLASGATVPLLPDGWCWVPLGFLGADPLATVQTGPFGAQLHSSEFVPSGVPVIAVGNLTGVGFTSRNLYHVTPDKAARLARYDVQSGDLLFARSGATLGKVCVAPDYVNNWRMTGHILRARLNCRFVVPEVVVFALWGAPAVQAQVTAGIRGMTRPGYNTALLESILIPVPPMPEQVEILSRIRALSLRVSTTEGLVGELLNELNRMDETILDKAFRGELVPQDPNDEPASVLLERIRAEREAAGGAKRRGRKGAAR